VNLRDREVHFFDSAAGIEGRDHEALVPLLKRLYDYWVAADCS